MDGDSVNGRTLWLLGGLAGAAALFVYSRTDSGSQLLATVIGGTVGTVTSAIRGIRNNNPTNLEDAGIQWDGMTGVDADGYLIFATMVKGLRAASRNLANYQNLHGINTVDGAIRRWSKTDQDAYVANVAAALGVDPHDDIDLTDGSTQLGMLRAMIVQETGAAASLLIPDGVIAEGIASA
jgi:hypothetical protein